MDEIFETWWTVCWGPTYWLANLQTWIHYISASGGIWRCWSTLKWSTQAMSFGTRFKTCIKLFKQRLDFWMHQAVFCPPSSFVCKNGHRQFSTFTSKLQFSDLCPEHTIC
jgi:hypothetical protein